MLFRKKAKIHDFTPEQISAIISKSAREQYQDLQKARLAQLTYLGEKIHEYQTALPFMEAQFKELYDEFERGKSLLS